MRRTCALTMCVDANCVIYLSVCVCVRPALFHAAQMLVNVLWNIYFVQYIYQKKKHFKWASAHCEFNNSQMCLCCPAQKINPVKLSVYSIDMLHKKVILFQYSAHSDIPCTFQLTKQTTQLLFLTVPFVDFFFRILFSHLHFKWDTFEDH